ncbi:hypothetical protein J0654_07365 [Muricauda lutimaris]|uniref:DUF4236 domain-containing protein n=1 Tax=Flagellimonas profundi TaxID=2915620 RepID=A0ABS3FE78_9FLAO|nr:hypothetical protein [Allomuricauda profundi]
MGFGKNMTNIRFTKSTGIGPPQGSQYYTGIQYVGKGMTVSCPTIGFGIGRL